MDSDSDVPPQINPSAAGTSHAGLSIKRRDQIVPQPRRQVGADEAMHGVHQVVVHHEQHLAKRHLGRPEHRQGDGSDQQHGGQHGEGALGMIR